MRTPAAALCGCEGTERTRDERSMKALLCEALGPAETLVIRDLPEPKPGPGEIAIRVKAAALNFFDTLVIQGRYQ
eukprot:gene22254-28336_t